MKKIEEHNDYLKSYYNGQVGVKIVSETLKNIFGIKTIVIPPPQKYTDTDYGDIKTMIKIDGPETLIECKNDLESRESGNACIEFSSLVYDLETQRYKRGIYRFSGILTTESNLWAQVVYNKEKIYDVIILNTIKLRDRLLNNNEVKKEYRKHIRQTGDKVPVIPRMPIPFRGLERKLPKALSICVPINKVKDWSLEDKLEYDICGVYPQYL